MCVDRMRDNKRVKIPEKDKKDKYSYLDILVNRCLESQVAKRCNWQEFLQIFTLHKMKCQSYDESQYFVKGEVVKDFKEKPTRMVIRKRLYEEEQKLPMRRLQFTKDDTNVQKNQKKQQRNILRPLNYDREPSLK